jgi:Zn-dependent peptidase ImmA (M78 family)/transcriptional regulator with XRE-family HTH domain
MDIQPGMIVVARNLRSLSQAQLAEQVGMSATNLSKIERGEIGVSAAVADRIADVLHFPPLFFRRQPVPLELGPDYKRKPNIPSQLLDRLHAVSVILTQHIQFLATALSATVSLPRPEGAAVQSGQALAALVRREWQLGNGPIANLVALLEEKGVVVKELDFRTERIDSRSVRTANGLPVIFINRLLKGDRRRYSLAYELGRLLLAPQGTEETHEANVFAASLLMPEEAMRPDFAGGVTLPLLATLKKKWKVSMIALLYRADDLGLLTPNQKRYLLQQFNQAGIRRHEPEELDIPAERTGLLQQWIAGYKNKTGFSTVEMAAILAVHIDDYLELYA